MLSLSGKKVYLACGRTDMRKSINGLAAIVEGNFDLDPFDGALFVFCNRNRDRVKILEWDGDGFWLYFKGERPVPLACRGGRSDNDADGRRTVIPFGRDARGAEAETQRGFRT